jgi:hypothetical protein
MTRVSPLAANFDCISLYEDSLSTREHSEEHCWSEDSFLWEPTGGRDAVARALSSSCIAP